MCLVQAEHRRKFFRPGWSGFRNKKVSGNAATWFSKVADGVANIVATIGLAFVAQVERTTFLLSGKRTHDGLHGCKNRSAALLPVGGGANGHHLSIGNKLQKVCSVEQRR